MIYFHIYAIRGAKVTLLLIQRESIGKKFKNTSYDLKDSDGFKRNCTFEYLFGVWIYLGQIIQLNIENC